MSEVGFGAWAIGGNAHGNSYGPTDDGISIEAVKRAVELGCTFFDTADVYGWGHSEELLGRALIGNDGVLIGTKIGGDFYHGGVQLNFDPDYVSFALEKSLQRLKRSYVDLYQLHNPPDHLLQDERLIERLEKLRDGGKIRHIGVSVHEPDEALAAMDVPTFETIQIPFNVLRQEWLEVFPRAEKQGVGVIAREPLANGFLTGKYTEASVFPHGDIRHHWPRRMVAAYVAAGRALAGGVGKAGATPAQRALAYVLSHGAVSTTIPGAKTPDQVEENMASVDFV